jgi:peptidyl-prolyl cis-trans isomerase C
MPGVGIIRGRMKRTLATVVAAILLTACNAGLVPATLTATPAPTIAPTPLPLAARVNGEGVLLADFQEEVVRFEAAQATLGTDLASLGDYQGDVLQALIDRKLLAQGAAARGHVLEEAAVEAKLEALAELRGGNEAMGAWLAENAYTLDSFKRALREDMLAEWMAEELSRTVGDTAEQARAAHILVASRDEAEGLLADLAAGASFADLAWVQSLDASTRPAGGDLGWSPQGYLLVPEVDAAVWALTPGETSDVIESALGYHIVRVQERGVQPLSPDAARFLREQAIRGWLEAERASAQIEILAP